MPPAVHDGRTRPVQNRRFPVKTTVVTLVVLVIAGLGLLAWMGLLPSFFGSSAQSGESPGVQKPGAAPDSVLDWAEGTEPFTVGVRDGLPGVALNSGKGGKPAWAGFEVDLAREIAHALGVSPQRLTFKATDRAQRPALLAEGDVDMVVSTYSINKVDEVTFAGPYYLAHIDVLVKDGSSITTVKDLEGKRLCQPGAAFAVKAVQRVVDRVDLVPVADYSQCMDRLRTGRLDAVPGDDLLLAGFANREKLRYKVVGLKLSTERYSVALRAGDVRGCQAVQRAITALYRKGTVKSLLTRHFGNVEFAPEAEVPRMQPCR
ncbi:ABC transporter substrate-binding protein [Spongiactinospora gelatinilytica]|uniref:ABC transporter substrate-binding protein n=1 Tax=Spongiactinospora gelatinilytica TaxID=2666298 RepID=A0A2W2F0X6_9ACTN|nr:ABC transporter substrate-binding protein [Spongiactinospora gelatinilytica]